MLFFWFIFFIKKSFKFSCICFSKFAGITNVDIKRKDVCMMQTVIVDIIASKKISVYANSEPGKCNVLKNL